MVEAAEEKPAEVEQKQEADETCSPTVLLQAAGIEFLCGMAPRERRQIE